jgi:glycosyltransferase involved in cell wall biosynthesis
MPEDKASAWFDAPVGRVQAMESIQKIPVHRIRLPDKKAQTRSAVFHGFLLDLCGNPQFRPDVLQTVGALPPGSVRFLKKLRALNIPTLYAYTLPQKGSSQRIKRAWQEFRLRRILSQVDCVISNSAVHGDFLRRLGVRTRIEVILNGVDLGRYKPAPGMAESMAVRRALSLKERARLIVAVGAVHPRKGIDLLLEAWPAVASANPEAELCVLGLRHDVNNPKLAEFRWKIQSLISGSGAAERIHFLGYRQDVPDILSASDLFVFPSRMEGMPNAMLEAMACGVPVVTCPFIGMSPDLGEAGVHFLQAGHDPREIAAACNRVLSDRDLHRSLSQNGRAWVEGKLDLERCLDRYAGLYHELGQASTGSNGLPG